jgi:protocatechuate 3,4-dioxygenase beta subunit
MLTLSLLLALPIAQTRPAQPRDAAPAPVGTAVVAGRVVADDPGNQPLRRVSVTLASGALQTPQMMLTDDAGRFRFDGVPAGTYTVAATRLGYVSAFYGSKRAGKGPGIPIAVLAGQQVTNINVRMLRGAVVTGTIRSPSGKPAPGLDILVQQIQVVDGRRRMSSSVSALMALASGPVKTDDRGVFRVYGLPPGDYVVQTTATSLGSSSEARQVTAGEIEWAKQTAAQGSMAVAGMATAPAPSPGRNVSYAPVYYPGTTVASEAVVVPLGPAEERRGIDFTIQLVPTARITGIVFDPEGRPLQGAQISLNAADPEMANIASLLMGEQGTRSGADGSFSISSIRPGRYTLATRGSPARPAGRQPPGGSFEDFAPAGLGALFGGTTPPWWASDELAVDGRDITDMNVRLQPGMTLSGRIVFEGSAPKPDDVTKTPIAFGAMPTSTSPMEMVTSMMLSNAAGVTAPDGTFVVKGLTPGRYRATVGGGSAALMMAVLGQGGAQATPWRLKSVVWNGKDIADVALDVKPNEDVSGIVVTMTDRPTELSGAVTDQAGRPTGSFPIVVFSTDRAYWTIGSRRVQQARPASDGKFKISGLPAGEYFVCAVTDLEAEDLANATFLDQLAAAAYKIRLADGQKLVQDLQLR